MNKPGWYISAVWKSNFEGSRRVLGLSIFAVIDENYEESLPLYIDSVLHSMHGLGLSLYR